MAFFAGIAGFGCVGAGYLLSNKGVLEREADIEYQVDIMRALVNRESSDGVVKTDVDDLLTPLRRFGRNTWNSFLTGTHTSLAEGLAGRPVTDIMQSRLTATKAYVAAGVPSESPLDRIQSIGREIGNLNNATADDKA